MITLKIQLPTTESEVKKFNRELSLVNGTIKVEKLLKLIKKTGNRAIVIERSIHQEEEFKTSNLDVKLLVSNILKK